MITITRPLTTYEAAQRLNISVNTLKRISPSELPYFRFGARGDRRYHESDIEHYIALRMVT